MSRVYLDHNATTPPRPQVVAAMVGALRACGNPSSPHSFGRAARKTVEDGRARVAALVGAEAEAVVFTGGGTEANALALAGAGRILVSAVEHDSVFGAVDGAEAIPVDARGVIDLAALEAMLAGEGRGEGRGRGRTLVALMLANNETGVLQPVAEAARLTHGRGALLHCDGTQAAGRIPVDMARLGADTLSLSAHKMGGPQGVGALVTAPHVTLVPQLRGGGQERRRRAGTENVPGIAGFAVAADLASRSLGRMGTLAGWRDRLEREIGTMAPVRFFGREALRLPNTSCFALEGVASEVQVMALDLAGVAVGAGAACSSGKTEPSRVLRAMGVEDGTSRCAIRVSLGWNSRAGDVDVFLAAWGAVTARRSLLPQ
ncbi:MAG: cysteine desulfurase [Alphaproteobacteria bacterium]|nr:cysteine desulfurase [Alphaproteobacteria bacterium]